MKAAELNVYQGADLCKKAISVANHYGFLPIEDVLGKGNSKKKIKLSADQKNTDSLGGELVAPMKFCSNKRPVQPVLTYYSNIVKTKESSKDNETLTLNIAAIGSEESIAEAIILRTAFSILEEIGEKDLEIHINSIGDKESSTKFIRECSQYFRKNLDSIGSQAQHIIRRDIFEALQYFDRRHHELLDHIPHPVDFLSEDSRKHLREVIEYLEIANMPYQFNHFVFGNHNCYSNTLFEIRANGNSDDEKKHMVVAKGGRYDEFSRRLFRSKIPTVGVVFFFRPKKAERKKALVTLPRRPKAYFIHIGHEAKLNSLLVTETLRQAKIPFRQSLSKELLSQQLEEALQLKVPYTIIMGQKEALDKTVIVRDMNTRAQESVPVDLLPQFIKEH